LRRVLKFFGGKQLSEVNGALCRAYAKRASTDAMARRDLEDLRAAINHHRREGLCDRIVSIVLPPRRPPRERWLDRDEAAALLWTAWRRPKCKHIAKFALVALYTGRRAAVVCGASFRREPGRSYIDTRRGMLYPPEGAKRTNKRNPPIPLPARLLVHLRAWKRTGQRYVVEWAGGPITRTQTVKEIARAAGLGPDVTPHVLRHTAATWQMESGTDMFEAGKYLGMTVRTLETTYAHHQPEHLTGARDAYKRHRLATAAR
jgi:integrase